MHDLRVRKRIVLRDIDKLDGVDAAVFIGRISSRGLIPVLGQSVKLLLR